MAKKWRPKGPLHKGADNPRLDAWIEDEDGLRKVRPDNPGEDSITVDGRTYAHTREIDSGQWVYTVVVR